MTESEQRLREWSIDELHYGRSVRYHEPIYKNPAQIRADVRDILSWLTHYRQAALKADEK